MDFYVEIEHDHIKYKLQITLKMIETKLKQGTGQTVFSYKT